MYGETPDEVPRESESPTSAPAAPLSTQQKSRPHRIQAAKRACGRWSGWADLNRRPPGPEPDALAKLRYTPTTDSIVPAIGFFVNKSGGIRGSQFHPESSSSPWPFPLPFLPCDL